MTLDHPDHAPYRRFTKRQRVDKAVHTLAGLLQGVSIDDQLNASEVAEIINWCDEYRELVGVAPFNEFIPKLDQILRDGIIDPEEQDELLWVCHNLSPDSNFYDDTTHDIQQLHGILHGVLADDHISNEEATKLQHWIETHSYLKGSYPYDEIDSLLTSILADGIIDANEQRLLQAFFEDFVQYSFAKQVRKEAERVRSRLAREFTLPGVCASCPEISFSGRIFTFTGTSMRGLRTDLVDHVTQLGGEFSPNLTQKTEFLVIGAGGNPCWAFSCYGRKVEKAVDLRKKGHPIIIVHESDFWDAVEDQSA